MSDNRMSLPILKKYYTSKSKSKKGYNDKRKKEAKE